MEKDGVIDRETCETPMDEGTSGDDTNLEAVLGEATEVLPDVSEHAIQTSLEDEKAAEEASQGLVDRYGRAFSPDLHLTEDDGTPKLLASGKLRVRRGKGLKDGEFVTPEAKNQVNAQPSHIAGQQIADLIIVAGVVIGGDDFQPIVDKSTGQDERAMLASAWATYCEAKDISDIPPGVAVTAATLGYIIPRLGREKTQTRVGKAWTWCKERYALWRASK